MLKARTEAGTQIRAEQIDSMQTMPIVGNVKIDTDCLKSLDSNIVPNSIIVEVAHSFNFFLLVHLFQHSINYIPNSQSIDYSPIVKSYLGHTMVGHSTGPE